MKANKDTYRDFGKALQSYFNDYLVKERGVSMHTIKSYSETFATFLDFMKSRKKTNAERVQFCQLDKDCICAFLNWLEDERGCKPQTRNQRYAAIKSFFGYMIYYDPTHMAQWQSVRSIQPKKAPRETLKYLSVDGVNLFLAQIRGSTIRGRRDLALVSLLYYSGMRVQELADLTPSSVRGGKPYMVEVHGKGDKRRLVAINETMMEMLVMYMKENKLDVPSKNMYPLFSNSRGEKLTSAGITHILKKYAALAHKENPSLVSDRLTPHWLRHSRAEHLLQGGVNLVVIRDLLGHVSLQTTEIYARINSKAKEDALKKANEQIGLDEPEIKSWEKSSKLRSYLKSLAK
jgi:site-specific recombinase XerD